MFFYRNNPNDPRVIDDQRVGDDKPVLDRTINPASDGFTRLSQADRASGRRPYVSGHPQMFGRHVLTD